MPPCVGHFDDYARVVEDMEVDNFGVWGGRLLLRRLGLEEPPPSFSDKAAALVLAHNEQQLASWWRSENLLHQRVLSFAEVDITIGDAQVSGGRFQQNGYQGWRPKEDWIRATTLPCNALVDRSLCSENQLLAKLCEDIAQLCPSQGQWPDARGDLQLYVTGAPCLSCAGP
ncbi:unnamed protein product [Effrenium voratum]|nr:unnamed protein product [Effrenium voratum]